MHVALQLYAEESTEDNDPGEADIDNADYDSNYDDDGSASHDFSGDYHIPLTYGARSSDFLDLPTSTSVPVPTSADPGTNEDMVQLLAALHKVEAKRGQDFERNVRENHKWESRRYTVVVTSWWSEEEETGRFAVSRSEIAISASY